MLNKYKISSKLGGVKGSILLDLLPKRAGQALATTLNLSAELLTLICIVCLTFWGLGVSHGGREGG